VFTEQDIGLFIFACYIEQLKFVAINILKLRVMCVYTCTCTSNLIGVSHRVRVLLQAKRTPALVHTLINRTADPEIKEEVSDETDQLPPSSSLSREAQRR
jgi:hypothetical protein